MIPYLPKHVSFALTFDWLEIFDTGKLDSALMIDERSFWLKMVECKTYENAPRPLSPAFFKWLLARKITLKTLCFRDSIIKADGQYYQDSVSFEMLSGLDLKTIRKKLTHVVFESGTLLNICNVFDALRYDCSYLQFLMIKITAAVDLRKEMAAAQGSFVNPNNFLLYLAQMIKNSRGFLKYLIVSLKTEVYPGTLDLFESMQACRELLYVDIDVLPYYDFPHMRIRDLDTDYLCLRITNSNSLLVRTQQDGRNEAFKLQDDSLTLISDTTQYNHQEEKAMCLQRFLAYHMWGGANVLRLGHSEINNEIMMLLIDQNNPMLTSLTLINHNWPFLGTMLNKSKSIKCVCVDTSALHPMPSYVPLEQRTLFDQIKTTCFPALVSMTLIGQPVGRVTDFVSFIKHNPQIEKIYIDCEYIWKDPDFFEVFQSYVTQRNKLKEHCYLDARIVCDNKQREHHRGEVTISIEKFYGKDNVFW